MSLFQASLVQKLTSKTKKQLEKKLTRIFTTTRSRFVISYKDTETNETTQKIQSVETTSSIVTETFEAEQNILAQ